MPINPEWKESAKTALTNLIDLGTNTLTGVMDSTKQKIQGAPVPVPAPPATTSNHNLLYILAGGALLYFVLKKK